MENNPCEFCHQNTYEKGVTAFFPWGDNGHYFCDPHCCRQWLLEHKEEALSKYKAYKNGDKNND